MASREMVREELTAKKHSQLDVLILLLSVDGVEQASTGELIRMGTELGVHGIKKWSISTVLSRGERYVIRVSEGWMLTVLGKQKASLLCGRIKQVEYASRLAICVEALPECATKQFLVEALACFKIGCLRAAVIMTWVSAMSVLYEQVLNNHLLEFNEAALKRNPKSKRIAVYDDLSNMKERDFLETACSASVIGKSVKRELESCLDFRNGCSHPNTLVVAPSRVDSFVDTLTGNVFQRYLID